MAGSVDSVDEKILDLIRENARLTYSEIGEKVGLSRVTVKNRMDAMERSGVIAGYRTEIDMAKNSEYRQFFLDIEAVPEEFDTVKERVLGIEMLKRVYVTTGECRIHAIGFTKDQEEMYRCMRELYNSTKGIRRLNSNTVLTVLRDERSPRGADRAVLPDSGNRETKGGKYDENGSDGDN
ncbi:MAG: Lrp/AsnC family transcriptional regulator [Lachnospiraceae bacterium]|nr:Lrp/AsnC family transcriptional regulator [Lachnospiraceae bacterium]